MDNPRERLVEFLRPRLIPGDNLMDFVEHVAREVKAPTVRGCKAIIWAIRAGKRSFPKSLRYERAWIRWLHLEPGSPEHAEFRELVRASRAWGKANGRGYLARLEAENERLRTRIDRLEKALEANQLHLIDSDTELERIDAEEDALADPETLRLPPREPGASSDPKS